MNNDADDTIKHFMVGVFFTGIAIAVCFFVGEATACSVRQNVRHECDTYEKTELRDKEGNKLEPYVCYKEPQK